MRRKFDEGLGDGLGLASIKLRVLQSMCDAKGELWWHFDFAGFHSSTRKQVHEATLSFAE